MSKWQNARPTGLQFVNDLEFGWRFGELADSERIGLGRGRRRKPASRFDTNKCFLAHEISQVCLLIISFRKDTENAAFCVFPGALILSV